MLSTDYAVDSALVHEQERAVEAPKFMHVTWESYRVSILTLALKIRSLDWEPDHIVCIGRGGMILGEALSRLFKKTLGVIMCSSYTGADEMKQGELRMAEHISVLGQLKGKVLLADDLVDSGKTLGVLKGIIRQKHADVTDVKTAVIYLKTCTQFVPDYFGEIVDGKVWIIMPNEYFDKVELSRIPKDLLKGASEERIQELAKKILSELNV